MPTSFPRWLSSRASRLGAALVECLIEAHGHAGLLARLSDARFLDAFARALGVGDASAVEVLLLLERGLRRDEARLGVAVSAVGRRVSLRGRPGVVVPERAFATDLDDEERAFVEARVAALLLAAHGPLPGPFARLSRRPGVGPRAALSLAVLADLVYGERPSPALAGLAFGSASGDPLPVPLLVYDEAGLALERMLHDPSRSDATRTTPLAQLYLEVERLTPHARPASLPRVLARERRLMRDLCGFTRDGPVVEGSAPPPLPRRGRRRVERTPAQWRPMPMGGVGEEAALEDLFLP